MVTYHFQNLHNSYRPFMELHGIVLMVIVAVVLFISFVLFSVSHVKDENSSKSETPNFLSILMCFSLVFLVLYPINCYIHRGMDSTETQNLDKIHSVIASTFAQSYPDYTPEDKIFRPLWLDNGAVSNGHKTTDSFLLKNNKTNQDEACKLVFADNNNTFSHLDNLNDKNLPQTISADIKAQLVCNTGTLHVVQPVK